MRYDHLILILKAADSHPSFLTPFEHQLIIDRIAGVREFGGKVNVTEKQEKTLYEIGEKLGVRSWG